MQDERTTQQILRRLKSVEGHIRGIQRMVEEGQYCIDIINQSAAVRSALTKIDTMVLERHLQSCVATAIRSDNAAERERVIRELLQIFQGGAELSRTLDAGEIDIIASPRAVVCDHGERSGV